MWQLFSLTSIKLFIKIFAQKSSYISSQASPQSSTHDMWQYWLWCGDHIHFESSPQHNWWFLMIDGFLRSGSPSLDHQIRLSNVMTRRATWIRGWWRKCRNFMEETVRKPGNYIHYDSLGTLLVAPGDMANKGLIYGMGAVLWGASSAPWTRTIRKKKGRSSYHRSCTVSRCATCDSMRGYVDRS